MRRLALLMAVLLATAGCSRHKWKGTVVVYTPFPQVTAKALKRAFEAKTDIQVIQVLEGTTRVFARIRAERNNPRADVWYGGGGMIPFITATQPGLLQPYKPAGYAHMPVRRGNLILRDPTFHWVGMVVIGLGYAYNPQVTPPSQTPKTWDDLANPRWKGQIEMWDPASSGTSMLFLDASLLRYIDAGKGEEAGWAYLTRIWKNLKCYSVEGPPAWAVARGQVAIGLHFGHQVLDFMVEQAGSSGVIENKNIRWYLPPDSPVTVDPIAMVKGAPHPKNARKFINFVLSKQGQAIVNQLFFPIDRSFGPPTNLHGMTRKALEARAQPLDPKWMAENYTRILKRWQNKVEAIPKN